MSTQYFRVEEHSVPCQHIRHYPRATAKTQEDELQLAVKHYTPIDNDSPMPGDVTIIAAHACGFGKELYEPLWDELLLSSKTSNAFRIRSIWFADTAHQGQSGLMNESRLGNDPSWFDHARDLLVMVNQFRKEMPAPLVGFGHSMGGNQILHLALIHPRLFTSLILVDPIIQPRPSFGGRSMMVAYFSTFKQDTWTTQEQAEDSFRKNPFYKNWDPRVLDLFIRHGLRQVREGQPAVTLSTSKHQEVFSVARPAYPPSLDKALTEFVPTRESHPDYLPYGTDNIYQPPIPFYRPESSIISIQLPNLRPHVLYITPTSSTVANPATRAEVVGFTGRGQGGSGGLEEGAVKEVIIDESDHFVPFSRPAQVASVAGEWLGAQMGRWNEEVKVWEQWMAVPDNQKRTVDKHWKTWIRRQYGKKKKPNDEVRLKAKM